MSHETSNIEALSDIILFEFNLINKWAPNIDPILQG